MWREEKRQFKIMRYGFWIKSHSDAEPADAGKEAKNMVDGEAIRQLKKGIRLMNWRVRVGYDRDDFVKNMFTIICQADGVKIPRFVRNYLLKKRYKMRRIRH
jgi:hypothetical protein